MSTQSRLGRSAVSRLGRLHAAQRARCFYCEQPITLRLQGERSSAEDATIDHFFPKSEGGADGWSNWVLACRACNNKKASRQPTEREMLAWNQLASAWPYIGLIDLTLVQSKRCSVCQRWISPVRLGESIKAGSATRTCRSRCGRSTGSRKTKQSPEEPPRGSQERAETRAPRPWWVHLLLYVSKRLTKRY